MIITKLRIFSRVTQKLSTLYDDDDDDDNKSERVSLRRDDGEEGGIGHLSAQNNPWARERGRDSKYEKTRVCRSKRKKIRNRTREVSLS